MTAMDGGWSRAVAAAVAVAAIAASLRHAGLDVLSYREAPAALSAVALFIVGGLIVWQRRPSSPVGFLMVVVGVVPPTGIVTYHFHELSPGLHFVVTRGSALLPVLLVAAHPDGLGRARRALVGACVAAPAAAALAAAAIAPALRSRSGPLAAGPAAGVLMDGYAVIVGAVAAAVAAAALRRWWRARGLARRLRGPVAWTAPFVAVAATLPQVAYRAEDRALVDGERLAGVLGFVYDDLPALAMLALSAALWWVEMVRPRLARTRDGVLHLEAGSSPLQDEVRRALGDATATLLFRASGDGGWVDASGRASDRRSDRALTVVDVAPDGAETAIGHSAALLAQPDTVRVAAAMVATDLRNRRLHALTLARLEETRASAARLLAASDAVRQDVEARVASGPARLLRDAANALSGSGAGAAGPVSGALAAALDDAHALLLEALAAVRAISHGSPPPVLDEHGLRAALTDLVADADSIVHVRGVPEGRLPRVVESTVYQVVATALASADPAELGPAVSMSSGESSLEIVVERAAAAPASLSDRVVALGGRLESVGGGWRVVLPLAADERVAG